MRPLVDIEVFFAFETDSAVLVKDDEDAEGIWLPKSQVEVDGEPGEYCEVTMPEWLAIERGFF